METRERRDDRREGTLVIGAIRMLGVLGWGRGKMGRKFGTQNFVKMNVKS